LFFTQNPLVIILVITPLLMYDVLLYSSTSLILVRQHISTQQLSYLRHPYLIYFRNKTCRQGRHYEKEKQLLTIIEDQQHYFFHVPTFCIVILVLPLPTAIGMSHNLKFVVVLVCRLLSLTGYWFIFNGKV
jgi:hypothetical protein